MSLKSLRGLLLLVPLAACAGIAGDQGRLQPQAVSGPCTVKKFYILNLTTSPTTMTVTEPGQACAFTVYNPDLQIALTAALVTSAPAHGQATASLIAGGYQGQVSYTPQPGYAGPDEFAVTLEPADKGVTVHVIVQGP